MTASLVTASGALLTVRQVDAAKAAETTDAAVLATLLSEMDGPARPADAAAIVGLQATLEAMASYPSFRAYLVLEQGVAVGSFSLLIFSSLSHGGARQALLDAVVVSAARRGAGVGQAMIGYALALARAAGCYKLGLSSNLVRQDAHRFYERLGFVQHGISFDLMLADDPA